MIVHQTLTDDETNVMIKVKFTSYTRQRSSTSNQYHSRTVYRGKLFTEGV